MRVDVGLELLPATVGVPDLLAPRAYRQQAAEDLEVCHRLAELLVASLLPPPLAGLLLASLLRPSALGDVRERHDYTVRLSLGESAERLGVELQPYGR